MHLFVRDVLAMLCMDRGQNMVEHVKIILHYLIIAETETV